MVSRIYDSFLGRKLSLPAKIPLSLVVLAVASWFGTSRGFYSACVLNVFLTVSLAGFALIYFRLQLKWGDVLGVLGAVGLLTAVAMKILHLTFDAYGVLGFLGLVSISAIALRAIWSTGVERKRLALAFLFAVVSVSSSAVAGYFHNWTARFTPKVFDLYLYSFDASLRVQLSFLVGQAFAMWHWFAETGKVVYLGFPLDIALVFAGLVARDKSELRPQRPRS